MEVIKIYSEVGTDEKLYSVLMSEEEIMMFQREFAFRDYEGLTKENTEKLAAERSRLAKELLEQRRQNKFVFGEMTSDSGDPRKLKLADQNSLNQAREQAADVRKKLLDSQSQKKIVEVNTDKIAKKLPNKTASTGLIGKAGGLNKTALGVTAGLAATATGAYLYNRNRKKSED